MALPKISTPTFEMIIPSTEQKVIYRPFLVKEEKILLMAMEGKDRKETARALKQIINNCCIDDIDVDKNSGKNGSFEYDLHFKLKGTFFTHRLCWAKRSFKKPK